MWLTHDRGECINHRRFFHSGRQIYYETELPSGMDTAWPPKARDSEPEPKHKADGCVLPVH